MSRRNGQAMLISILTIGGAILGATTLAGLLLVYQIRSTTDSANSAKAIFAADSGVNWALYSHFDADVPAPVFSDGATVSTICYDSNNAVIDCGNASATTAIAEGLSSGARRAFLLNLVSATETLP